MVPGSLPGELVKLRRIPRKYQTDIGQILDLSKPSHHRIESDCPFFPECPGCQFRHLSIDCQWELGWKSLFRAKRFNPSNDTIHLARQNVSGIASDGYRIRTVVRPFCVDDSLVLGMRAWFPELSPIPMRLCRNHAPELNHLIGLIEDELSALNIQQLLRVIHSIECHLSADGRHRIQVTTVGNQSEIKDVLNHLICNNDLSNLSWLHRNIPTEKTRAVYQKPINLIGTGIIRFPVGNITFSLQPTVWTPVAYNSSELLLNWLKSTIEDSNEQILELGCGGGLLSVHLAQSGHTVTGVDKNRWAIDSARLNVPKSCQKQLSFRAADAAHAARKLLVEGRSFNTVIIHGMRRPYGSELLKYLSGLKAQTIIIISPSVKSWTSDICELIESGWKLHHVSVQDQIPHTSGFLTVGCLRK